MQRARKPNAVLATALALSTLAALAPPGLVGADHGGIHVQRQGSPDLLPFQPAGSWVRGAFHVTHGSLLGSFLHRVYDPVDDSWISAPASPLGRPEAAAASIGGKLYVAGGFDNGHMPEGACEETSFGDACTIVESYEPTTRTWTRLPDMPTARAKAGVAALDGLLYVVGGTGDDLAPTAVEAFDPATGNWTLKAPLPLPRSDARTLTTLDGKLYLLGGEFVDVDNGLITPTKTVFVYDPYLNVWTIDADYPVPVIWASAGNCDGKLLAFGGFEFDEQGQGHGGHTIRQLDHGVLGGTWTTVFEGFAPTNSTWDFARGGGLTAGPLTLAAQVVTAWGIKCPVGTGPWETDADLVPDDLLLSTPSPSHGETVQLSAVVRNRGAADAGAFVVEFRDESSLLATASVAGLAAGASVTVQGPPWGAWANNFSVGTDRNLTVVVDPGLGVVEWNEANNQLREQVSIRLPDLTVASVALSPADAGPGETARISAVIHNVGPGHAVETRARFQRNGTTILPSTVATPAIPAGGEVTVTSGTFTVPQGAFLATVRADASLPFLRERNETNNVLTATLQGALAELTPTLLASTPAEPRDGETTTFSATLQNRGNKAAGPFTVRFALDGLPLAEVSLQGLAAGETTTMQTPPWTAAEGTHTLVVTADVLGQVQEPDESDNAASLEVVVGPPRRPNLVVDVLYVDDEDPHPGQELTVRAVVRNAGDGPSGASVVRFVADGADLGDAVVPALAAGASATVEAPDEWRPHAGIFIIRAKADPDGGLTESNEEDNAAEAEVVV